MCQTLCNPTGCILPGSSVYGVLQARILEWVAISFSRGPYWPRDQTQVSCIGWQILYGRDTSALGTHLVLFFTLPRKGGASPYTFQEGDEGRGPSDCSLSPYSLLGRRGLRWFSRLSVIWKEKPDWASSGFPRPGAPPTEGKVRIVPRGNLTQSLPSWKPKWPLGSWGAWPHAWSLPHVGFWALTITLGGD